MSAPSPREWSAILAAAVTQPGVLSHAYHAFWNYSVGNQLLAWFECHARQLTPGPLHTYRGWRELGRQVRQGERAITLCMPVTCRAKPKDEPSDGTEPDQGDVKTYTRFVFRPHWFVLAQTDGADYVPMDLPTWQEGQALEQLEIERIPFRLFDGNTQGYALARTVSVSTLAAQPHRTLFHELAHVVLGHTAEPSRLVDGRETTPRDLREVEAECVALICCEALGLPGSEFSRGYIQHWLRGTRAIPERSAQRIFAAADRILRAGRTEVADMRQEAA